MADVQIRFRADSQNANREINQLTKEIQELRRGMEQTQRPSTEAAQAVDRLGDEATEAAIGLRRWVGTSSRHLPKRNVLVVSF